MRQEIIKQLKMLEKENGISILFAVETGSRVWRLQSKDSDYDIRFVYLRSTKDYLRINKQPDVIDRTIGDFDFVGFDIYKFIKLFLNSNPTMIEWLQSDIVYIDDGPTNFFFKKFIEARYNPLALYHHYKSMCKGNYRKYLKSGDNMTYKKYLYSMRGLINAKWVTQFKTLPPIDFNVTLKNINHVPDNIIEKLREIIKIKKEGLEKSQIEKIPLLESYIEEFLKQDDEVESRKIGDYSGIQNYLFRLMEIE